MLRQGRRDLSPEVIDQLIACFSPIKAEDDIGIDNDAIFVRTHAYAELADRQRSRTNTVLLGRKGDGKTALIRRLAHDLQQGQLTQGTPGAVQIFEQIDMEESYFTELVSQFRQIKESIQRWHKEIPDDLIAKKLWTKYLQLVALRVGLRKALEFSHSGKLVVPASEFEDMEAVVLRELDAPSLELSSAEVSQGFLKYMRRILRRLSAADQALADTLAYDASNADPMQALQDIPKRAEDAAMHLAASPLHVTIALDRFDDFVDRLVSDDFSATRHLRRQFLHGLIAALYHIQRQSRFGWLRLVASLPDDLVVDLDFREIAAHQRLLFVKVEWSLHDLQDLLDSRVASVIGGATWSDLFPLLVASSNKRIQIKETPAQYLIRHTTRRPRELMTHASNLFRHLKTTRISIDSKTMNQVVAKTNMEIVETQSLPEWKSVLPTLSSAIERLHRMQLQTVFGYLDIRNSGIANVLLPGERGSTEDTRTLLALSSFFRVGLMGFRVRRATAREGYLHQGDSDYVRYVFAFSPAKEPVRDICALLIDPKLKQIVDTDTVKAARSFLVDGRHGKYDLQLCISPMFFESLAAEHDFPYIVGELEANGFDA